MHFESIYQLAQAIKSKQVSPVEVTQAMLKRIESVDSHSQAYLTVTAQRALAQARQCEKEIASGLWRGWLHGIPLALKDIIYTDFAKTTAGTAIHREFQPDYSATVVERLETAGAVTMGKLTTTEQAFSDHHPSVPVPRNPWGDGFFCGCSSSGSGVAAANGLAFGTLGSDTGGSIRIPSAANGVTGLKPTWGRVSRHGVFALGDTLDHIGPMTRSAVDAAIMMNAIAGFDPKDVTSLRGGVPDYVAAAMRGIQGLRIGLPYGYATDGVDAEVVSAWERAAQVLTSLGALTRAIEHPHWEKAVACWPTLCAAETAWAHRDHHPSQKDSYGAVLSSFIELGQSLTAVELAGANIERLEFRGRMQAVFDEVDLFLIPVFPTKTLRQAEWESMAGEDFSSYLRYTIPADLTSWPTITIPAGFDSNGMPIGLQLCGPAMSEDVLCQAAAAFQRVTDWHLRRPV